MAEPSGGGNKSTIMVLAFATGVMVGMNWPKIKKHIGPLINIVTEKTADAYTGLAKFLAEQKEKAEDKLASTKIRKVKPAVAKKGALKVRV